MAASCQWPHFGQERFVIYVFLRQPDPGGLHDRPRIDEACDRTLLDASSCEECAASSPWYLRASTCVGASLYGHTHARTTPLSGRCSRPAHPTPESPSPGTTPAARRSRVSAEPGLGPTFTALLPATEEAVSCHGGPAHPARTSDGE